MGTFNTILTDTAQVYLDTFGETIQHWPCGRQSEEEDITAIFDEDALAGPRAEPVEDDRGTRIKHEATIEVLPGTVDHESEVVKGGFLWKVIRPTGKDAGLEAWSCERTKKIATKPQGVVG